MLLGVRDIELQDALGRPELTDISFDIHAGEVLGIAGVEGNGQTELVETLIGMRHPISGSVRLGDQDISDWSTRERRESGIGYIPEDRQRHGLLLDSPLWENRILGHQTRPPSVKGAGSTWAAPARTPSASSRSTTCARPASTPPPAPSPGGNQQKFIVGREMSGDPVLLIASHPTRGVDVGAQAQIWDHIKQARRNGLAVLLISADLDELIGLSDTIRVLLRGRLVRRVRPADGHATGARLRDDRGR